MYDFDTELINLSIAGHEIKLNKIKDIDLLYDALLAKGEEHEDVKDERIPYWAELWPSSIALSRYLFGIKEELESKDILEIGCGLGLCGISAGLLAGNVTLSDYMDEPLKVAKENWLLNLDSNANFIKIDWRYPPTSYKFDVILAADVLYEKRSHSYIAEFISAMLNPGGKAYLADPRRSASKEFFIKYANRLNIKRLMSFDELHQDRNITVDVYKIEL